MGPVFLLEGVRGQHDEHHDKQNNDNEENKGWFAITIYFCNYYNHALLPVVRIARLGLSPGSW